MASDKEAAVIGLMPGMNLYFGQESKRSSRPRKEERYNRGGLLILILALGRRTRGENDFLRLL